MNNASYIHALRGPIMLTTLGVLMAMDHFYDYSFWRTWPALLIVMGLMILLCRVVAARPQDANPGGMS